MPDLDSIIEDHLEEAGLTPVLHEEEDDSKEVPAMSAVGTSEMLDKLVWSSATRCGRILCEFHPKIEG